MTDRWQELKKQNIVVICNKEKVIRFNPLRKKHNLDYGANQRRNQRLKLLFQETFEGCIEGVLNSIPKRISWISCHFGIGFYTTFKNSFLHLVSRSGNTLKVTKVRNSTLLTFRYVGWSQFEQEILAKVVPCPPLGKADALLLESCPARIQHHLLPRVDFFKIWHQLKRFKTKIEFNACFTSSTNKTDYNNVCLVPCLNPLEDSRKW